MHRTKLVYVLVQMPHVWIGGLVLHVWSWGGLGQVQTFATGGELAHDATFAMSPFGNCPTRWRYDFGPTRWRLVSGILSPRAYISTFSRGGGGGRPFQWGGGGGVAQSLGVGGWLSTAPNFICGDGAGEQNGHGGDVRSDAVRSAKRLGGVWSPPLKGLYFSDPWPTCMNPTLKTFGCAIEGGKGGGGMRQDGRVLNAAEDVRRFESQASGADT